MKWQAMVLAAVAASLPSHPATAQQEPASVERVNDTPGKVICKTFLVTGSLVKTHKVCGTKHDWEVQREDFHNSATMNSCRLLGDGGAC